MATTINGIGAVRFLGDDGTVHNAHFDAEGLRSCSQPYLQALAEGDITGHTPWTKIGYVPFAGAATQDVWSYGGTTATIPLMSTAATVKLQSNNAADAGTSIFSGTSSGGSTTTLIDATKNFNGGTAVAVGDCVILDKSGTVPEFGYVTAVTSNTELAIAGGFSKGGTGSTRDYTIIDYTNQAGAHAVSIVGLDTDYNEITEILVTAGAGPGYTTSVKQFLRINSVAVIATGANAVPTAALAIMDNAAGPTITYAYITAGYTRSRTSQYTVPAGKVLYIYEWDSSFVSNTANKVDYCRLITKAAQYVPEGGGTPFRTTESPGVCLFFPYTEICCANSVATLKIETPTKILPKTTLKVTGVSSGVGVATIVLRGWLENA